MRWFLAVCFSCALFAASTSGTFLPIQDSSGVQYLFVGPSPADLFATLGALVLGLGAVAALVAAWGRRLGRNADNVRSGRWTAPLVGVGILAMGLLPAVPGVGARAAPASYFLYDLRWWWVTVLVAWTAWRADDALGHPVWRRLLRVTSWTPSAQLLLADAALFTLVIAWAIVTSPLVRFSGVLYGDEPRYLRYCETWYQGHGCDVSQTSAMADERLDAPPHLLSNVTLLGRALIDDGRAMWADAAGFLRAPRTFVWNRAPESRFGIVVGRHGSGWYQLHQPGLDLLLLPGYVVDRYLLATSPGDLAQFPGDLPLTNGTMLLLLGVTSVVLFRLLRRVLDSALAAWLAAAVATLSFPVSAFAFQFYPETAAATLVLSGVLYVVAHARGASRRLALVAGAGVAALPWLHPRFLVVAAVLGAAGIIASRRSRGTFLLGWLVVVASVGYFNYHITGSWMPNSLYAASTDVRQFNWAVVIDNAIAYVLHAHYGLLPHAAWLWAVIPGLALMARRQPAFAALVTLTALALIVPAAGHALNPAGGTPGRFIVAIVPLLMWPAAVFVRDAWSSTLMRVATVVGVVLSLALSQSYNEQHTKPTGLLVAQSVSGWAPPLAFPDIRGYFERPWPSGYGVFLATVLVLAAAAMWTWQPRRAHATASRRASAGIAAMWVCGVWLSWSTAASAALNQWTLDRLLVDDSAARAAGARALVTRDRCDFCFSSSRARVTWHWLRPNPIGEPDVQADVTGSTVHVTITLGRAGDVEGFSQARIEFGDGRVEAVVPIVGRATISHTYDAPGTYRVRTQVSLGRGVRLSEHAINIP